MIWTQLYYRAYELCLKANRYEVIPELPQMDVAALLGVIARFTRLLED